MGGRRFIADGRVRWVGGVQGDADRRRAAYMAVRFLAFPSSVAEYRADFPFYGWRPEDTATMCPTAHKHFPTFVRGLCPLLLSAWQQQPHGARAQLDVRSITVSGLRARRSLIGSRLFYGR